MAEKDIVARIEELMDLFGGEVTTADKIQPPENPFKDFKDRNPQFKAGGGRAGYFAGALVQGANVARPFVSPLVRKGAEALTGTAVGKRLSDIFFSKDEGEDTKKK